jgi:hypothetical protein
MTSGNYNIKQKQIYFKAYQDFSQLENTLKHLEEARFSHFKFSVLGKEAQFYFDKNMRISKDTDTVKAYWNNLLGSAVNFGSFYNLQIETIFIVGFLTSIFLHKINGKSLATLSCGSYGIFRGMGATEIQATHYLKLLNGGDYLLIVRGFEDKLQDLETRLNKYN